MNYEDIKKSREFISLVIRSWRGNMYLAGLSYSDKELAKFVGVTPVYFSRMVNGTATASLPVYRSLMVAISDMLGASLRQDIAKACYSAVYENK